MRHRRADRCVARAEAALEAGMEEEARAALAEARTLSPETPDLERLRAAVETRKAAARAELKRSRTRRALGAGATAGMLLVAVVAIWPSSRDSATPTDAPVATAAASVRPADAAQGTQAISPSLQRATQPPDTAAADSSPGSSLAPTSGSTSAAGSPDSVATDAIVAHAPSPVTAVPAGGERSLPALENVNLDLSLPKPATIDTSSVQSSPAAATGADRLVTDLPAAALPVATAPPPMIERAAPKSVDDHPVAPAASEEPNVRAVLAQFESAYSSLSASAARAVWPSVDERSLARAFDSLESQQVSLGKCSISLSGASAFAECDGNTTWTPRIGGGRRSQPRRWQFDLASENGAWYIVRATAR